MRRYSYNKKILVEQNLRIEGDLYKHIFKVCRRSVGDQFELLSESLAYLVRVTLCGKGFAEVLVVEKRKLPKLKKPYVHLVLANPRPLVFENVVEKAVELGVKSIYPVVTQKSFYKNVEKLKLKETRIKKIIRQAMQQTGRSEELELKTPMEFGKFLEVFDALRKNTAIEGFMLYEAGFESMDVNRVEKTSDIFILVGGEGGFSFEEASNASLAGFKVLLLGEQILRVETACVVGISILKSKLGVW